MKTPDPIKKKIEDLVLQVDEVLEGLDAEPEVVESVRELRTTLLGIVNPEAPRWGIWEYEQRPDRDGWIHCVSVPDVGRIDDAYERLGLEVTFFFGQMDGKPVVQIDGSGDFRINVNDCPVWDQSTETRWSGGSNAAS